MKLKIIILFYSYLLLNLLIYLLLVPSAALVIIMCTLPLVPTEKLKKYMRQRYRRYNINTPKITSLHKVLDYMQFLHISQEHLGLSRHRYSRNL